MKRMIAEKNTRGVSLSLVRERKSAVVSQGRAACLRSKGGRHLRPARPSAAARSEEDCDSRLGTILGAACDLSQGVEIEGRMVMATTRPSTGARERVTNPHVDAPKSHGDPRSGPAVSQDRPARTRLRWGRTHEDQSGSVFSCRRTTRSEEFYFCTSGPFPR